MSDSVGEMIRFMGQIKPRVHEECKGVEGEHHHHHCIVCLMDIQIGEQITRLTKCVHIFHAECVDPWLNAKHTCPVCRSREDEDEYADPDSDEEMPRLISVDGHFPPEDANQFEFVPNEEGDAPRLFNHHAPMWSMGVDVGQSNVAMSFVDEQGVLRTFMDEEEMPELTAQD